MVCLALKMEDDGQNHLFHREWNKVINNAMKGVESFLVGHVICWALERDGLFPGGGYQAFQAGVCMKRDLFVAGSLGNPLLGLTQGLLSAADRFPTHASMAHRRCQGGPDPLPKFPCSWGVDPAAGKAGKNHGRRQTILPGSKAWKSHQK